MNLVVRIRISRAVGIVNAVWRKLTTVATVRVGGRFRVVRIGTQLAAIVALAVVEFGRIGGVGIGPRFVAVLTAVCAVGVHQSVRLVWITRAIRIVEAISVVRANSQGRHGHDTAQSRE